MLALRARGLGSAWTTMTCRREPEVAAVLGVDHERYTQVGMFPVAYTLGTDFKPAPAPRHRVDHPLERVVTELQQFPSTY